MEVNGVKYKDAKTIPKKVVIIAKNNAFESLYQKLETKECEKDVFRLAQVKELKTRDLGNIRCIKDDDGKIFVEESKIRERWWSYFSKLFNGEMSGCSQCTERGDDEDQHEFRLCSRISKEKVSDTLTKVKTGKKLWIQTISLEI